MLNNLAQKPNVSKSDIDGVTCDIENIFHNAWEGAFGTYTPCENAHKRPNKPWFNAECRLARNSYHKIWRLYNRFKTDHFKNLLKTVSKNYKHVISKNVRRHKNVTTEKLCRLKPNDRSKSKGENHTAVKDFCKYFENLNNPPNYSNDEEITNDTEDEKWRNKHADSRKLNSTGSK